MRSSEVSSSMQLLGELHLALAGTQYYQACPHNGESVRFVREPDSPFDRNSIRVENERGEPVGHISRRIARWMSPLIDSGKIHIEGSVPDSPAVQKHAVPLRVSLFLSSKGHELLEPVEQILDSRYAVHNMVLSAYLQRDRLNAPGALQGLVSSLRKLLDRDTLPQTHLLFSLMRAQAEEEQKTQGNGILGLARNILTSLLIEPSRHFHNLTLFPLRSHLLQKVDYLTLADAIHKGSVQVTEVSEGGQVPTLRVLNHDPKPVFIAEGEILVGGKQNRTVNLSVIVEPFSEFVVPVSCVEQGRWHRNSPQFNARHHAPPDLRARKMESVSRNRATTGQARSDQGRVWEDCQSYLDAANVHSATSSITETYQIAGPGLRGYRESLVLPEGCQGFLMASNSHVLGMDLFDSGMTLKSLWPRLSESYFLKASCDSSAKSPSRESVAQDFLDHLSRHLTPCVQISKGSKDLEIRSERAVGSAVFYKGQLCHLSAFEMPTN